MINWFVVTKFHAKLQLSPMQIKVGLQCFKILCDFSFSFFKICIDNHKNIININVGILQVLFHEDGSVKGIATNDVGIHKDGSPKVDGFRCEICACIYIYVAD